jgi:hypothetical protein
MIQRNTIRCFVLGFLVLVTNEWILAAQNPPDSNQFSKEFANAAIETLGSMREWATNLGLIIKKEGIPGRTIDRRL